MGWGNAFNSGAGKVTHWNAERGFRQGLYVPSAKYGFPAEVFHVKHITLPPSRRVSRVKSSGEGRHPTDEEMRFDTDPQRVTQRTT